MKVALVVFVQKEKVQLVIATCCTRSVIMNCKDY